MIAAVLVFLAVILICLYVVQARQRRRNLARLEQAIVELRKILQKDLS